MSISPRGRPPGPLSSRNQSGRSERADGGQLRNPARGAADTPALATSRSKALQEDVGRNQARVMSGVDTATPGPLPSAPEAGRTDASFGRSSVMRMPAPPMQTATRRMQESTASRLTPASEGRGARRRDVG